LISFLIPGRLDTPTGGYIYDRRIIDGLRASGLQVEITGLSSLFPFPDETALDGAARALADIPPGTLVVVDGLAGGAMPAQIEHEATRLRIVALVHHPLARETGLSADAVRDLEASERRTLTHVRHVPSRAGRRPTSGAGIRRRAGTIDRHRPGTVPAFDRKARRSGRSAASRR
jgi:hypothetical protein